MIKTPDELKRPDPAYMLYTADFLVRTQNMSDEQVGKYIRILCCQHQNGHLTEAEMLAYCKGLKDELIFAKFLKDKNGLYYNEEMEKEVQRRKGVCDIKSENAKSGWGKRKNPGDQDSGLPF